MNIKMVATDLDRTLLRSDKSLSRYSLSVIKRLREKGILFMIATARPESSVRNFVPELSYDFAVFHNGALVDFCDGKREHYGIPPGETMRICREVLFAYPEERVVVEMDNVRYANRPAHDVWPEESFVITDFSDLPDKPAEKILIPMNGQYHEKFREFLSPELYLQISDGTLCMMLSKQARKKRGIQAVCDRCGITLSETAAFGDDLNDLEMLSSCGMGIAVSNAVTEVREIADAICPSNDEDGVARWLEDRLLCMTAGDSSI